MKWNDWTTFIITIELTFSNNHHNILFTWLLANKLQTRIHILNVNYLIPARKKLKYYFMIAMSRNEIKCYVAVFFNENCAELTIKHILIK